MFVCMSCPIMLSVLIQFTASDYPFGIFFFPLFTLVDISPTEQNYHTVWTVSKSNRKTIDTEVTPVPLHTNTWPLTFLTCSMQFNKMWWGQLVLWRHMLPLRGMVWSCTCFPHVGEIQTLKYNRAKSVIIKNAIILNSIGLHSISNLRYIEWQLRSHKIW
jgi:hypothetical protein